MINYFYNKNLSLEVNTILFWTWQSIVHHLYFIALFLQRQLSDKWAKGELWRVNMEKECEFFQLLFGGNSRFCADASIAVFSGLWFRTGTPSEKQLNWVGRLVANYQHSEAIIHFFICFFGFIIVYQLGSIKKKTKGIACGVPAWIRWGFFLSLFVEVYSMCFPYFFLFIWAWLPFVQETKDPLVQFIEDLGDGDSFLHGIQFGAALITMLWVAITVTVLDTWAMIRAWDFVADGKSNIILATIINAIGAGTCAGLWVDFFSEQGRGSPHEGWSFSEFVGDNLHSLFGGDYTPQSVMYE